MYCLRPELNKTLNIRLVQKGSGTKVRDLVPPSPTPNECFKLAVQTSPSAQSSSAIILALCCCAQLETKNSAVAAVPSVAIACLVRLAGFRALSTVLALFLFLLLFLLPLRLVLNFFLVGHRGLLQ